MLACLHACITTHRLDVADLVLANRPGELSGPDWSCRPAGRSVKKYGGVREGCSSSNVSIDFVQEASAFAQITHK